jgi:hypothetical protein
MPNVLSHLVFTGTNAAIYRIYCPLLNFLWTNSILIYSCERIDLRLLRGNGVNPNSEDYLNLIFLCNPSRPHLLL